MGWPETTDERDIKSVDMTKFPRLELLYDSAKTTEEGAISNLMHGIVGFNMAMKRTDQPFAIGVERP